MLECVNFVDFVDFVDFAGFSGDGALATAFAIGTVGDFDVLLAAFGGDFADSGFGTTDDAGTVGEVLGEGLGEVFLGTLVGILRALFGNLDGFFASPFEAARTFAAVVGRLDA